MSWRPTFHEKLSINCQFESTRFRGFENAEEPRDARPPTLSVGRPKSRGLAVFGAWRSRVFKPKETLGSPKIGASCGKNPLRYRFQPNLASFTFSADTVFTQLIETS